MTKSKSRATKIMKKKKEKTEDQITFILRCPFIFCLKNIWHICCHNNPLSVTSKSN